MLFHYMDIIPFILGTAIVLLGPMKITINRPLPMLVVFTTAIFLLAQSTWFTSFLDGNEWGRDWANVVWFVFNTCTMVIFAWILFFRKQ